MIPVWNHHEKILGRKFTRHAENLLKTTNGRISDIAYDCGFNDMAYFSKSFSQVYHASPSNYRKQFLNDLAK